MRFRHYIFSRVNTAFVGDEKGLSRIGSKINSCRFNLEWLEKRCKLLEQYTLPSLRSQTVQDFEFVLLVHSRTPREFKDRLEGYAKVVYSRIPPKHLIPEYVKSKTDTPYVVTSNLDSDDALSIDYVQTVQQEVRDQTEFLNFLRGFKYSVKDCRFYGARSKKSPYMSFVEETAVMQGIHVAVHGKCDQVAPIRQIGQGGYWIQVCHDDNLINKAASRGHSGKSYDDIRERFVIDGV